MTLGRLPRTIHQDRKTALSPYPLPCRMQVALTSARLERERSTPMGLRRHLQTNQVLASCPIPTALGSARPQLRAPHSGAGSLISTHGLQPCKDEGRNLSVFSDHPISHKAIISIFPFLCKSGHTQPVQLLPSFPVRLPTVSAAFQLPGSKNHRSPSCPGTKL